MTESNKRKSAPYLPFATFISALDNIQEHAVPNVIDRSCFPSFSGASVASTLSALKFFDLITDDGIPAESLRELAMNTDYRKANIKDLLERFYPSLIELDLSRATPSQFDNVFTSDEFSVSGNTRVKAKTFFIKAAQFAEIPISQLLLKKARSSGPRKKRAASTVSSARPSEGKNSVPPKGDDVPPNGSGTQKTIRIAGGDLTIIANVNLLLLTPRDREFLFKSIDLMTEYESAQQVSAQNAENPT